MEAHPGSDILLPRTIFAVRNPAATHAAAANHHIHRLIAENADADMLTFETQDVSREENRRLFVHGLTNAWRNGHIAPDKTWVVVAGGDGTLGNIAEALVSANEELRTLPIFPIGVGNANDVAHGLHGSANLRRLSQHYSDIQYKKVRPLECTIASADNKQTHTALGYISFGASAFAAEAINTKRTKTPWKQLPGIRHFREAAISIAALKGAGTFELEETDGQGIVQTRRITDRLFVNGTHMAKYLRFPVGLSESTYFTTDVRAQTIGSIVTTAARMASGRQGGRIMQPYGSHAFTALSPTKLQVDGEVYDVPEGASISVSPVAAQKALTFASIST